MIEPVKIEGGLIAKKFWGKKWCNHLESFADCENRLPRGRTYVRNGSVAHLSIQKGCVKAIVSGSELYDVVIKIKTLDANKWEVIKKRCSGQIGSLLELLQGKLSDHVMGVVTDDKEGLFPSLNEIELNCNCFDWTDMCKHVAAVLYGVGNRLDSHPELLFTLRGVDVSELVDRPFTVPMENVADRLEDSILADIFNIDLEPVEEKSHSLKTSRNEMETCGQKVLDLCNLTGKKIRALREKKGLSVAEFAKALGVTTASIYRWEQSRNVLQLHRSSRDALNNL